MSQNLAGSDPNQALSDDVIALLRTIVPILWGFIASWLLQLGIPSSVLAAVHGAALTGLSALLAVAWYALWRWASPHIPPWLVMLVLGYAANPTYKAAAASTIPRPREE